MNKKTLSKLKQDNMVEYVVSHGNWRLQRGKRLSAVLLIPYRILNPEKAYAAAKKILDHSQSSQHTIFNRRGQTRLEEMLDILPPHEPPWPGARKVPFTCYQWY